MDIPASYTRFGSSNDGNQVTYRRDNATAAKPRIIILDRAEPVFNSKTGTFSVPSLKLRVLVGTVDQDGQPKPERLLFEGNFRTPIGSEADIAEWKSDVQAIIADSSFWTDVVEKHAFPDCCADEE